MGLTSWQGQEIFTLKSVESILNYLKECFGYDGNDKENLITNLWGNNLADSNGYYKVLVKEIIEFLDI